MKRKRGKGKKEIGLVVGVAVVSVVLLAGIFYLFLSSDLQLAPKSNTLDSGASSDSVEGSEGLVEDSDTGSGVDKTHPGTIQPECSDGIDNDGDKRIDYPNDKGCDGPRDEAEEYTPGCKEVYTAQDLDNVRNDLSGCYVQMQDIDLSGRNWVPIGCGIGESCNSFYATYDGRGYKITNLFSNHSYRQAYVGLFGILGRNVENIRIHNATVVVPEAFSSQGGILAGSSEAFALINNVEVIGSVVQGSGDMIGGLVGKNYGIISNSLFSGEIIISGEDSQEVGGLVGKNYGTFEGLIINSRSFVEIKSSKKRYCQLNRIGGLVGSNEVGALIGNSYSVGKIETHYESGGLAGHNYGEIANSSAYVDIILQELCSSGGLVFYNDGSLGEGTIRNSFSNGRLYGKIDEGGGLVQLNAYNGLIENSYSLSDIEDLEGHRSGGLISSHGIWGTDPAKVSFSYSKGLVMGIPRWGYYPGGLIRYVSPLSIVENSYWDTQTSGQTTSAGGEGKTTAQMKSRATYKDWDFDKTWMIYSGRTYPWLRWQLDGSWQTAHYPLNHNWTTGGKRYTTQFAKGGEWPHAEIFGATIVEGMGGWLSRAMLFDGNDYINTNADIDLGRELTINSWVRLDKKTSQTGQPVQILITKTLVNENWAPYSLRVMEDDRVEFAIHPNDAATKVFVKSKALNVGQWHMVTAVLSNGEMKIYIDGELNNQASAGSAKPYDNDENVFIGAANVAGGSQQNFFNGAIDDVRIYNRGLLDFEIKNLFAFKP